MKNFSRLVYKAGYDRAMADLTNPARRDFLRITTGAMAAGAGNLLAQSQETLRGSAMRAGLVYGAASDQRLPNAPPPYAALFFQQAALYAASLSWVSTAPNPQGELYDYDSSVALALKSGLKLTGAHFLWNKAMPGWFRSLPTGQAQAAVATHIRNLGSHFRGSVFSWNVINEEIDPAGGRPDGLRNNSPLLRALGVNYIPAAFQQAQAADPAALRIYNDFDVELNLPDQTARRSALLRLLDLLLKAKAPISGVGIQSHLRLAQFGSFNPNVFRGFLREISARGLKIMITELDVDDRGKPTAAAARDRVVADIYHRYLSCALDEPAVIGVVTWGLVDQYSWYNMASDRQSFARLDKTAHRPLPFDNSLKPKPAFYAMIDAFNHAPRRPPVRV